MPVIELWSPDDRVLGRLGGLALALAAGGGLVVALDAPAIPGRASLASLVEDGPTRRDLTPHRRGVAYLPGGGDVAGADAVLEALVDGWPATVLVHGDRRRPRSRFGPVVPVRLAVPPALGTAVDGPAVHQRCAWPAPRDLPGVVLPRPLPGELPRLAAFEIPTFGRWVRAWRRVWRFPWP